MKSLERDRRFILGWLREEDPARLETLWQMADQTRREYVGEAVHLRGLLEISNCCVRQCAYCGLRAGNSRIDRYRMEQDEILEGVRRAERLGYGTVVLQAGEDYGLSTALIESLVRRIKAETPLAVTLSLGERPEHDFAAWKRAGADRYFLRFETSDGALYRKIHPARSPDALAACGIEHLASGIRYAASGIEHPTSGPDRIAILETLKALGYQTGSGVMIGIPGQSYTSLAEDILLFRALDLDMIGVGPYLPHPHTPMGAGRWAPGIAAQEQVPNSELMTYKVLALIRVLRPDANIPATTALASLNRREGYERGLMRGANVVMPNLTPSEHRRKYEIYPGKVCFSETALDISNIYDRIRLIGRTIGKGPGDRIRREGKPPAGKAFTA